MAYPPQPHPQDPWGRQTQEAPQGHGRPPRYGQPPAQPGYGPPGAGYQGYGYQEHGEHGELRHGPQPRQGGPPPPGFDQHELWGTQSPYDRQGPLYESHGSPNPYGQGDPYGLPDYGLPPRHNNTMTIWLSVGLGLVLLVGGTIGAVAYVRSAGPKPAALPTSATSFPTTAPWQSGAPSAQPSQEPSEQPSGDPTGDPTGDPGTAAAGSPLQDSEFDDWKFNLSGVKFDANKVEGWTYDSCDPVDGRGVLAKNKCESAIQVAYSAYRGHLKAVQVIMAFPSDSAAKTAAARLSKLTSNAVNIRSDMTLPDFTYGKIQTNASKRYVVTTVVTADKTAQRKAQQFHIYLQADSMSYCLLRDTTVTS
ncbi:hypothetical protein AB0I81_42575 [Nonomuraea sp. NPDC050404]|uniref:hypothetical protein n=1 Tax=Nonomuraea sp. NPDC050404 TaxID=3155783 RepID=UPI0033E3A613